MRRARLLIVMLAGLLLSACDQEAGAPAIDWPAPSPALWEVRGPDDQRGWLFGTIHRLPEDVEWTTPPLDRALAASDVLVLEITEYDQQRAIARQMARMGRSDGLPPVSDRVDPDAGNQLEVAFATAGITAEQAREYETWSLALLLSAALDSSDASLGVDRALYDRAGGKAMIALETVRGQFEMFDRLAQDDQAALLESVVKGADTASTDARRRAIDWMEGDLQAIAAELDHGVGADPELRAALVERRNLRWTQRIANMLDDGRRPFVAVGTAHLIGDRGLPALLEQRGFTLRRIQ